MNIAILGYAGIGYVGPMATGLSRMLARAGVANRIFWNGLQLLRRAPGGPLQPKRLVKSILSVPLIAQLKSFDVIVVVQHLRDAFADVLAIEWLRQRLPDKPIVLYDLVYLPTVGLWGPWLPGAPGHIHGLDRYDAYLCVSTINRCPMPPGPQPCFPIGIDLDDGSLYPEQGRRFLALVDFERKDFPRERAVQLQALQETETEFIELKGSYPIMDIRKIYRTISLYFLAHMESFGLPICELQACGARIMTPRADWCDAHRLLTHDGTELSHNFCVYGNDVESLKHHILEARASWSASATLKTFHGRHPHYFHGDLPALKVFLDSIASKDITAKSHLRYTHLTKTIPLRPGL